MMILVALFFFSLFLPAKDRVCSVHDGDTFRLCSGESIRLWGVDAPEISQPWGKASRDNLVWMVRGKRVRLDCPGQSYQRAVCRVMVGRRDINQEMVKAGLAYDSKDFSRGRYAAKELIAKRWGLGIWGDLVPQELPWDYRRRVKNR